MEKKNVTKKSKSDIVNTLYYDKSGDLVEESFDYVSKYLYIGRNRIEMELALSRGQVVHCGYGYISADIIPMIG